MTRTPKTLLLLCAGGIFLGLLWFIQTAPMGPAANGHPVTGSIIAQAGAAAMVAGWLLARALWLPVRARRQRLAAQYAS